MTKRAFGLEVENDGIVGALDPWILERTDDAPTEEGKDAIADVLLRAMLDVTETLGKDGTLVVGAKVIPYLLLW